MNYYTLDIKFIGNSQLEVISLDIETDGLNILSHHKGKSVKSSIAIENAKLDGRAKLLDFLRCSLGAGNDFTASEDVCSILRKFNCESLQFFSFSFPYGTKIVDNYFYVHFTYKYASLIDYFNSEYDEMTMEHLNGVKPEDYDAYIAACKTDFGRYNRLRLKSTKLRSDFPIEQDIFMLNISNQKIYISERLYSELKKHKFSGVSFKQAVDLFW
jgi:hypothetical protein